MEAAAPTATDEEREAAAQRIREAVLREAHVIFTRLVDARETLHADISLRLERYSSSGPELVIDARDLTQLALATLFEACADSETGFGVSMHDGVLRIEASSWPPDRIPF